MIQPGKSDEMSKRYAGIFENGFDINEALPNFNQQTAEQIRSGVDSTSIQSFAEIKNGLADLASFGVVVGSAVTGAAVMGSVALGVAAGSKAGRLGGAGGFLFGAGGGLAGEYGTLAGIGAAGAVGGGVGGGTLGTAASYALSSVVKSGSLQWFIAAPILFAKCLEEDVVSIMPLTKNGVPMVSGLSLKDPAMMWRNIFGRLYNYAADTAVGLQDLAWMWEMSGDNWWESFVAYSSEGGLYDSIRSDYRSAAGGQ